MYQFTPDDVDRKRANHQAVIQGADGELDRLESGPSSVDVVTEDSVDGSLREIEAGEAVLYVR